MYAKIPKMKSSKLIWVILLIVIIVIIYLIAKRPELFVSLKNIVRP